MNPLYQQLVGGMNAPSNMVPRPQNPFQNPLQRIMMAMRNPAAFVKNAFPDIPNSIANDPNQILSYLQRTRGISDQDISQLTSTYGGMNNGYR